MNFNIQPGFEKYLVDHMARGDQVARLVLENVEDGKVDYAKLPIGGRERVELLFALDHVRSSYQLSVLKGELEDEDNILEYIRRSFVVGDFTP